MNDHELMTLAAKAVGYEVHGDKHPPDGLNVRMNGKLRTWSPLVSDGDAFRLMVDAGVSVDMNSSAATYASADRFICIEPHDGKKYAATRRAIVRAAAAMAGEL